MRGVWQNWVVMANKLLFGGGHPFLGGEEDFIYFSEKNLFLWVFHYCKEGLNDKIYSWSRQDQY